MRQNVYLVLKDCLFINYDNDTESLIESFEEIEEIFYKDLQIGIEVEQLSKEQIYNVLYEMNKN